jgi:hypothetical protein
MKSFASRILGASVLVSSTALVGCSFDLGWDGSGFEGFGETWGEGIACGLTDGFLVPIDADAEIQLAAFGLAPRAIATDLDTTLTVTFVNEPTELEILATGAAEIVEIGETTCGGSAEGNENFVPYQVPITLRAGDAEGAAKIEVRLGGKTVQTFDLDVKEPKALDLAVTDENGLPVTKLVVNSSYYVQGYAVAEDGTPIFSLTSLSVDEGTADFAADFIGGYLTPYKPGELVVHVVGALEGDVIVQVSPAAE